MAEENLFLQGDEIDDNLLYGNIEDDISLEEEEELNEDTQKSEDTSEKDDDNNQSTSKPKEEVGGVGISNNNTNSVDKYWDIVKSLNGEGYEIPKIIIDGKLEDGTELSDKDRLVLLRDELFKLSKLGNTDEDDDFIKNYIVNSYKENFNQKEFLKSHIEKNDILTLPTKEFLFHHYKQELGKKNEDDTEGMTDDEIKEYLNKADDLFLKTEEKRLKKLYKEKVDELNKAKEAENEKAFLEEYNKIEEKNSKLIKDYINSIGNIKNIEGIEFGEADLQLYKKQIPELIKREIKEVNGRKIAISKAEEILHDITGSTERTFAFLPLIWMIHNNKFKGYTTSLKEKVKKDIESKLEDAPKWNKGLDIGLSDEIDDEALMK